MELRAHAHVKMSRGMNTSIAVRSQKASPPASPSAWAAVEGVPRAVDGRAREEHAALRDVALAGHVAGAALAAPSPVTILGFSIEGRKIEAKGVLHTVLGGS